MSDRHVYLFELDSVRNSDTECAYAQQSLFCEVIRGNSVVLSLNQIADSRAFQGLLTRYRQEITELFEVGALKTAQYYDAGSRQVVRTASQYYQNAIDRAMSSSSGFHFSGQAIRSEERFLLEELHAALRCSDPNRLREDSEAMEVLLRKNSAEVLRELNGQPAESDAFALRAVRCGWSLCGKSEREFDEWLRGYADSLRKRLTGLKDYVEFLLTISRQPSIAPLHRGAGLEHMLSLLFANRQTPQYTWKSDFSAAVSLLREIKETGGAEKPDKRSCWYGAILARRGSDDRAASAMAELLVDLCYNCANRRSAGVALPEVEEYADGTEELTDVFFADLKESRENWLRSADLAQCDNDHPAHFLQRELEENPHPVTAALDWRACTEILRDIAALPASCSADWETRVRITQHRRPGTDALKNAALFLLLSVVNCVVDERLIEPEIGAFVKMPLLYLLGLAAVSALETVLVAAGMYLLEHRIAHREIDLPDVGDILEDGLRRHNNWKQYRKYRGE